MKKQELRGAFSQMRVPDACVEKVLAAQDGQEAAKRCNVAHRIVAAAAALAIFVACWLFWPVDEESYVTAPGLLVVRAYELDELPLSDSNSIVMAEGVELPLNYYWKKNISHMPTGIPLNLYVPEDNYPGMEITFEVVVSDGHFIHQNIGYSDVYPFFSFGDHLTNDQEIYSLLKKITLGNRFVTENGMTLYWRDGNVVEDANNKQFVFSSRKEEHAFADIIVRADGFIVGYAVVEFYDVDGTDGGGICYSARILKTASFPKVDGRFQKITTQSMEQIFREIHGNMN